MNKLVLATACAAAAALTASPVMASPIACATAPVSTYTATGFSCSVDNGAIVFSNINVTSTTTNGAVVALGNFIPFSVGDEFGLTLTYSANTGTPPSVADVAWTYNVSGSPSIVDAYMAYTATTTGTGTTSLSETLSNGVTLALNGPGVQTTNFAPVSDLGVIKDQNNFSGSDGRATASVLTDAFSVAPIPGTLPLLAGGLIGLFALGRKRKQRQTGGRLETALT